ncbi:putative Leucine--tRNA ligase [Blattamonas nauphoetae]|uniref:Leucine--tRNA ligase n=1 Tax=Blattamonas nauphoetae TaxID=2049346 RepID=A0ABQ9XSB3_9EUKA|nr:putative Leucine--tRNA ligase [Blattamonas nauphoetae]
MLSPQFRILKDIADFSKTKWENEHTFEVAADPYGERPKKTITTPMPYTDSLMSINRASALTTSDVYANYASMKGFNVLYSLNFHFSGTRIKSRSIQLKKELEGIQSTIPERLLVSGRDSEFQNKAPNEKTNMNISGLLMKCGVSEANLPAFEHEEEWMRYFAECGKRDAIKLGLRVDWRRSIIASKMNPYFVSFVNWQMTKLQEHGHAQKARIPMIWSERLSQPCLDHDRIEGASSTPMEYQLIKHSLLVLPDIFHFPSPVDLESLESEDQSSPKSKYFSMKPTKYQDLVNRQGRIFCLSTTARPESIATTVGVFVHPKAVHGGYMMPNGDIFICTSRAAHNIYFQHCSTLEAAGVSWEETRVFTVSAQDLIGLPVDPNLLVNSSPIHTSSHRHLHDIPTPATKTKCIILPGRFINDQQGTGFVEARPGDNVDQFILFKSMIKNNEMPNTEYTKDIEWDAEENYFGSVKIDHPDLDDPKQKKLLFDIQIPKENARKQRLAENHATQNADPTDTPSSNTNDESTPTQNKPQTVAPPLTPTSIPQTIQPVTFSSEPIKKPAFRSLAPMLLTPDISTHTRPIYLTTANVIELYAKDANHPTKDEIKAAVDWMLNVSFSYGTIAVGRFKGLGVREARVAAKEYLFENDGAIEYYETSVKTVSTAGDECVVRMGEEWVLTYSDEEWRDQVQIFMQQLDVGGSDSLRLYLQSAIQNIKDRPFTHRDGMGVPLCLDPIDTRFIEPLTDSTVYPALYTIAHLFNEGIRTNNPDNPLFTIDPDLLTPEVWEYILNDGPIPDETVKIPLDVWKRKENPQASVSPQLHQMIEVKGIPIEALNYIKHEYNYWYPIDLRVLGVHLRRNHLIYSLFMHTDLLPLSKFPRKVLVLPEMTVEGRDPHMTSKYFTPFTNTIDELSADGMRVGIVKARKQKRGREDLDFSRQIATDTNMILLKELVFMEQVFQVNNFDLNDIDDIKPEVHGPWLIDYSDAKKGDFSKKTRVDSEGELGESGIHTVHSMQKLKSRPGSTTPSPSDNGFPRNDMIQKQRNDLSLMFYGFSTTVLPDHILSLRERPQSLKRREHNRIHKMVAPQTHSFSSPSNVSSSHPLSPSTTLADVQNGVPDGIPDTIPTSIPGSTDMIVLNGSYESYILTENSVQPVLIQVNDDHTPQVTIASPKQTEQHLEPTKSSPPVRLFFEGKNPSLANSLGSLGKRASPPKRGASNKSKIGMQLSTSCTHLEETDNSSSEASDSEEYEHSDPEYASGEVGDYSNPLEQFYFNLSEDADSEETFGALVFHSQILHALDLADTFYERGEFDSVVDLCLSQLRQARDEYLGRSGDHVSISLLRFYSLALVLMMSPITPHWAEFIYCRIFKLKGSVRKSLWPTVGKSDRRLLRANAFVGTVVKQVQDLLSQKATTAPKKPKAKKPKKEEEKREEDGKEDSTPILKPTPSTMSANDDVLVVGHRHHPDTLLNATTPIPTPTLPSIRATQQQFLSLVFDHSTTVNAINTPVPSLTSSVHGPISQQSPYLEAPSPDVPRASTTTTPQNIDDPTSLDRVRFHLGPNLPNTAIIFVANGYTDNQQKIITMMENLWEEGQNELDSRVAEQVKALYGIKDGDGRAMNNSMKFVQSIKKAYLVDGVSAFDHTFPFVESSIIQVNKDYIHQSTLTFIKHIFVISKTSRFPRFLDQIPSLSKEQRDLVEPEKPIVALFFLDDEQPVTSDEDSLHFASINRELRKKVLTELQEAEDSAMSQFQEQDQLSPAVTPLPS